MATSEGALAYKFLSNYWRLNEEFEPNKNPYTTIASTLRNLNSVHPELLVMRLERGDRRTRRPLDKPIALDMIASGAATSS